MALQEAANSGPVTIRRNQIPLQSSFQQNWSLRPINRIGLAELTESKNAVQWLNGRSNFPTWWQVYGGKDPVDNMSRILKGGEAVGFVHERDIIFAQCFLKLFYCFFTVQCTGRYLDLHYLDCTNIAFPIYSTSLKWGHMTAHFAHLKYSFRSWLCRIFVPSQTGTTPKLTGLYAKPATFLYSHTVFIKKKESNVYVLSWCHDFDTGGWRRFGMKRSWELAAKNVEYTLYTIKNRVPIFKIILWYSSLASHHEIFLATTEIHFVDVYWAEFAFGGH